MPVDIEKWLDSFKRNEAVIIKISKKFLHDAGVIFRDTVSDRTPIGHPEYWKYPAPHDYVPGSLKAAWELDSYEDREVIHNDLPYAQRVEYGWSTQAPEGMMRITIKDLPSLIRGLKLGDV